MKRIIQAFLTQKESDLTLTDSTKKSYASMCKRISEMVDVNVDDIDMSGLSGKERGRVIQKSRKIWVKLHQQIKDRGLSEKNYLNMYSILISYAQKEYGYSLWNNYRLKEKEKPVVVLSDSQVEKILFGRCREKYRLAHYVACVQLQTTLRITDVLSLTYDNIKNVDGLDYIETVNKKTGKVTSAPVTERVREMAAYIILQKPSYMDIWKQMSDYLSMSYGIDGSSHIFRRSAITYMLNKGIPAEYVKHLSGHSQNSRAFARYVNISNKTVSETIRKLWKSL